MPPSYSMMLPGRMSTPLIFMSLPADRKVWRGLSGPGGSCQEVVHVDAGVAQDRAQGAFRDRAAMLGKDRPPLGCGIGTRFRDFPPPRARIQSRSGGGGWRFRGSESRQACPSGGDHDRDLQRFPEFDAGITPVLQLQQDAGIFPPPFDGLLQSRSFGHESLHVLRGYQVNPLRQFLDAEPDDPFHRPTLTDLAALVSACPQAAGRD